MGAAISLCLLFLLPGKAAADVAPHTDVMFVFDTSGSMGDALSEASAEIQDAMTQIEAKLPDVQFGLSEVRDYGEEPTFLPWQLDVPITADTTEVTEGIGDLYADGGGDGPEAYGRALWEADTNPNVGWRAGARHLIVLVADNVPHDNDLDEGIPTNFWVESSPWNTGEELREPADIPGTEVTPTTNLDWQSVLATLDSDGKPLEFVDYHGESGYLPYWEVWAGHTGGLAVAGDAGQLVPELLELAVAGAQVSAPPSPPAAPKVPAPSAPPAPAGGVCAPVHGSVGKELLASVKCTAALTKYEAICGAELSVGKLLKGLETAKGLYVLSKVGKKYRPAAKLINDIKTAKFLPDAPRGLRTGDDVIKRIDNVKTAKELVLLVTDLSHAVSWSDFKQIALDLGDIVGVKGCVEGLILAVE